MEWHGTQQCSRKASLPQLEPVMRLNGKIPCCTVKVSSHQTFDIARQWHAWCLVAATPVSPRSPRHHHRCGAGARRTARCRSHEPGRQRIDRDIVPVGRYRTIEDICRAAAHRQKMNISRHGTAQMQEQHTAGRRLNRIENITVAWWSFRGRPAAAVLA